MSTENQSKLGTYFDFIENKNETYYLAIDLESFFNFRIIVAWLNLIIIVLGLVTNIISLIVFIRKKNRSSTNVFIAGLCISAILVLIAMLINNVIYSILVDYSFTKEVDFIMRIYPYFYPIYMTFFVTFIYLTVSISLNQFFYIYYSKGFMALKNNAYKNECKHAFNIVCLVYLLSFLFCIPYWLKFKYSKQKGIEKTELGLNKLFYKIVQCWLFVPFVCILPIIILILTNIYLIIKMNRSARRKSNLSSNPTSRLIIQLHDLQSNNLKIKLSSKLAKNTSNGTLDRVIKIDKQKFDKNSKTNMIILAVAFFLVCHTPNLVFNVMESFKNEYDSIQLDENYLIEISKLLLTFVILTTQPILPVS